jgi:hypothetical protein
MLARAVPAQEKAEVTAAKLPRWRGFNLLEKFTARCRTTAGRTRRTGSGCTNRC